ncbi:PDR/VanB family oxidoreductase [Nocardia sp. NPDC059246]|uniref:PDR/VanB family oxidoreductase n=1 Tax=unclassified Nocardia TaxID=2637762 RepID=UPI003690C42D
MTLAATRELTVTAKDEIADGVVALTLAHPDGLRLPDWAPGAHLDLILPNGMTRQYSLCGNRWDAYRYQIGVLRTPDGRGGSAYVHDTLTVGDSVAVGGPRNNFVLVPAARYLFLAGGIGITPIMPMIAQAELLGSAWRLCYAGRQRRTMAFADELAAYGDNVVLQPSDEFGRLDLRRWLQATSSETVVYCCGPSNMVDAVRELCVEWPAGRLRIERFVPKVGGPVTANRAFDVELRRSGLGITVSPGQSVLEAVQQAGVGVLSSCGQGVCGTCETTVLAGEPDHRDSILDDSEREAGNCMFICVSRSRSDRLTLDL